VPDSAACQEQEIEIQITLGQALLAEKGQAAQEPGEAFARARQLCEQLNRPSRLRAVLPGQFAICLVRGELGESERYAGEIYHLGEAQNDVMWKCFGSGHSGIVCGWLGRFIDARNSSIIFPYGTRCTVPPGRCLMIYTSRAC